MFEYEVDEEIILKHIRASNAPEIFKLTNESRESLREWLPWVDGTKTEEDSLQFIQNALGEYDAKKGLHCGIFFHGELVGMISFNSINWANRIGFIGYWLASGEEGQGIMTRAVRGLIDYAFQELDINRIDIRAAYENKRSRAIPERLGFKQEGIIRQAEWLYDHYVDHVIYGLLRSDWE